MVSPASDSSGVASYEKKRSTVQPNVRKIQTKSKSSDVG
jgi:hypothetical protein